MAKKVFSMLVLAALAAGGVSAQTAFGVSAGVGGLIGGDFGGGLESSGGTMKIEMPYFGGGGFAFLDATYAELSLGISGGGGKIKMTMEGGGQSYTSETDWSITNFNIGLLGKYPIAISDRFTLFPLLGIDILAALSAKDEDGNDLLDSMGDYKTGDLTALWFKFGGGADFSITEKFYARLGLLYGLRLPNKVEKDMADDLDGKTLLGHGLSVKLAVGYRFF
jgi:hypothetical protein